MVWNGIYTLRDTDSLYEFTKGKTVDICTVRSPSLAQAPLGTLFWALIAANAAQYAKEVNIYDFVTGNLDQTSPSILPIQELADFLEFPSNIHIVKAEDVKRDFAWNQLREMARYDRIPSGIHRAVADALPQIRATEEPSSLYRIAEELAVFLEGYNDSNRVQLSAHERETVAVVRALPITVQKQYTHVATGIDGSEFRRGRICTVGEFGDALFFRQSQGAHYQNFYKTICSSLASRLFTIAERRYPYPTNIEGLWIEDAKRKGMFYNTSLCYQEGIALEGTIREWSMTNFASMKRLEENDRRFEFFYDTVERISVTLFPHLLLGVKNSLPMPFEDRANSDKIDSAKRQIARGVERALETGPAGDIDLDYIVQLIALIGEERAKEIRDKLVDCLLTQDVEEKRVFEYCSILPTGYWKLKHYYKERKAKRKKAKKTI